MIDKEEEKHWVHCLIKGSLTLNAPCSEQSRQGRSIIKNVQGLLLLSTSLKLLAMTRLGAPWSSGKWPCSWQGGWNEMGLRSLPSKTIPGFHDCKHSLGRAAPSPPSSAAPREHNGHQLLEKGLKCRSSLGCWHLFTPKCSMQEELSYFHVQPLSPFPSETAQTLLEPEGHLGIKQGCFFLPGVSESSCWWVWPLS